MSDIQNCFQYIIKKHEKVSDNAPMRVYVNQIKNIITFKINTGYNLKLLTPEMMKLLGSSTKTEDENGENIPHLEITNIVLVHYNIILY